MNLHKSSRRTNFSAFGITCSLLGVMFYLFVVPPSESSYAGTINLTERGGEHANLLMKQKLLAKSVEEFLNQSANPRLKGLVEEFVDAAQQPNALSVKMSDSQVGGELKEYVSGMSIDDQKLLASFFDKLGLNLFESVCDGIDGGRGAYHFGSRGDPMALAWVARAAGAFVLRGDPFSCPKKGAGPKPAMLWYMQKKVGGSFQDEKESPLSELDSYRLGIQLD